MFACTVPVPVLVEACVLVTLGMRVACPVLAVLLLTLM